MTRTIEEMGSSAEGLRNKPLRLPVLMEQTYSMKNLSEKKSGIENTVKELRELISHITQVISHASEILAEFKEMTSGSEVIEPRKFSIPGVIEETPKQARERDKETNEETSEPKQATTITY